MKWVYWRALPGACRPQGGCGPIGETSTGDRDFSSPPRRRPVRAGRRTQRTRSRNDVPARPRQWAPEAGHYPGDAGHRMHRIGCRTPPHPGAIHQTGVPSIIECRAPELTVPDPAEGRGLPHGTPGRVHDIASTVQGGCTASSPQAPNAGTPPHPPPTASAKARGTPARRTPAGPCKYCATTTTHTSPASKTAASLGRWAAVFVDAVALEGATRPLGGLADLAPPVGAGLPELRFRRAGCSRRPAGPAHGRVAVDEGSVQGLLLEAGGLGQ